MPKSWRQVADIFRNIHFLCATKNSSPEAVGEDWSQSAKEILWWNLMTMWWNSLVNLGQKYEDDLGF